jgi:hypothetical protein
LPQFITRNDTSFLRLLQFLPEHLAIIIYQNNDWVKLQFFVMGNEILNLVYSLL